MTSLLVQTTSQFVTCIIIVFRSILFGVFINVLLIIIILLVVFKSIGLFVELNRLNSIILFCIFIYCVMLRLLYFSKTIDMFFILSFYYCFCFCIFMIAI